MRLRSVISTTVLITSYVLSLPADTIYSEATQGDLSNSGLTPTPIAVTVGSNQIIGTTGNGGSGIDRDYFTISVPTGLQLTALIEVTGTTVGGAVSFIGLQAGNQVTVPTNASTANGLLGWAHYGGAATDTDLFSVMSVPNTGSSGFTPPLNAGNYSFWIQDFNAGTFTYHFNLVLAPVAAPVPEPKSYTMMLAGLVALAFWGKGRRRSLTKLLQRPNNSLCDNS